MVKKFIKKIKLHNFKKFTDLTIPLDENLNIFIGENEAGKSTILSAIDFVISGSRQKVEKIGIDQLFNKGVIESFLSGTREYKNLPIIRVELFLNEQGAYELNGIQHSDNSTACDGIFMEVAPSEDFSKQIIDLLKNDDLNFPFEYYSISFKTFSGEAYNGYRKHLQHIVIDTTQIGTEYATKEYVNSMYSCYIDSDAEKNKHQNDYRKAKEGFKNVSLKEINGKIENYSFSVKHNVKSNLLTDLTLLEGDVDIEQKGKGKQCFIKTKFVLGKAKDGIKTIDVALIEEPENHLSHINMKKLIQMIDESENKQRIIATHSNLICSRLDLRKAILLHTNSDQFATLEKLPKETAKFFIKAPDHGVLNFTLSKKVILVEGDAEYMIMERFYYSVRSKTMEFDDVYIISVGGTSFKRYLDIAKILNIKVAVIRDNDENYQSNCVDLYNGYVGDLIKIFFDQNNSRHTFEKCLYEDNKEICDNVFESQRRTLSVQDYMIKNKTESAFCLLDDLREVNVPQYIQNAIRWINS